VPHHDKPLSKELLHEVNNQLEIVVSAAELLSRQHSDPEISEFCAQIQTAAFKTSKILKTYFIGVTPFQPAPNAAKADVPVVVERA
jgi:light-regulated signal transduction histidine kinase (bacteriophytochrome)